MLTVRIAFLLNLIVSLSGDQHYQNNLFCDIRSRAKHDVIVCFMTIIVSTIWYFIPPETRVTKSRKTVRCCNGRAGLNVKAWNKIKGFTLSPQDEHSPNYKMKIQTGIDLYQTLLWNNFNHSCLFIIARGWSVKSIIRVRQVWRYLGWGVCFPLQSPPICKNFLLQHLKEKWK